MEREMSGWLVISQAAQRPDNDNQPFIGET